MLVEQAAAEESKTDTRLVVSCQRFLRPLCKVCETNAIASFRSWYHGDPLLDASLPSFLDSSTGPLESLYTERVLPGASAKDTVVAIDSSTEDEIGILSTESMRESLSALDLQESLVTDSICCSSPEGAMSLRFWLTFEVWHAKTWKGTT